MEDDSNTVEENIVTVNIGEHLRKAREAASMSVEDVSSELRIHVNYVEDIENNQFDNLNGPTYVKGYLRNYARLLELDSEPLITSYQSIVGEEPEWQTTTVSHKEQTPRRTVQPRVIIMALAVVALLLVWLFMSGYLGRGGNEEIAATDPTEEQATAADETATAASETPAAETVTTATPTAALPALVSATGNPQAETAGTSTETPAKIETSEAKAEADVNTITLGEDDIISAPGDDYTDEIIITFTDECWVEIQDVGRNKLLHGLYQADDIKLLLGRAPFQVFLGNAAAVAIDFNSVKFDVVANTRRNGTARFALVSQ